MTYQRLKIEQLNETDALYDYSVMKNIFSYSSNQLFGLICNNFKDIIPPVYEEIILAFENHFWGKKN